MVTMRIVECLGCGKHKEIRAAYVKQRYCSISCAKQKDRHHNWKGGRAITPQGYISVATGHGSRLEHLEVAERALGKPLPDGAEVHHFDEDRSNNDKRNLVICENRGYHMILHSLQKLAAAGFDPHSMKHCGRCGKVKSRRDFSYSWPTWDRLLTICKLCNLTRVAAYKASRCAGT